MSTNLTQLMLDQQAKAVEEIACYGLPYGGIGFTSHILTYYTIATHLCGRKPLKPWKSLKYRKFSPLLGVIQLIMTVVTASISIHRCQKQWFFVILGVWMLTTSIALSFVSISMPFFYRPRYRSRTPSEVAESIDINWQPRIASKRNEITRYSSNIAASSEDETIQPGFRRAIRRSTGAKCLIAFVALLWFLGCLAGVIAIVNVTGPRYNYETQDAGTGPMYIVTLVFGGLCFLPLVCLGLIGCFNRECCTARNCCNALILTPPFICAFALLWMDWGLGIVTGNLVGSPNDDIKAIYWTYFAAKRLPMLSGVVEEVLSRLGC
jgi:hypothetical protein